MNHWKSNYARIKYFDHLDELFNSLTHLFMSLKMYKLPSNAVKRVICETN